MLKGIVLAGGTGSRLYPITRGVSKQLLPVYDKPMIYYPISALMLAGIRDVMVITTAEDRTQFVRLLGDGSQWGIHISFAEQERPAGLGEAFIIGEKFIGSGSVALVLGDNIFFGHGLSEYLSAAAQRPCGATVFAHQVQDPERYGVVEFNDAGRPVRIREKPSNPKSNWAVTGLYFFDNNVVRYAKQLKPSSRGELEITDLQRRYLATGLLDVVRLGRGFAWFDAGTFASLIEASQFVQTLETRQGVKVCCPEEIAFWQGYITADELFDIAISYEKSGYGSHLLELFGAYRTTPLRISGC